MFRTTNIVALGSVLPETHYAVFLGSLVTGMLKWLHSYLF